MDHWLSEKLIIRPTWLDSKILSEDEDSMLL
jgi:hypothetical protein